MQYRLFDITLVKNKINTDTMKKNITKILTKILQLYGYNLVNNKIKPISTQKQINDKKLFKLINDFLKEIMQKYNNPQWLIYGKISCPYCKNAKNLAIKNNLNLSFIEISTL